MAAIVYPAGEFNMPKICPRSTTVVRVPKGEASSACSGVEQLLTRNSADNNHVTSSRVVV